MDDLRDRIEPLRRRRRPSRLEAELRDARAVASEQLLARIAATVEAAAPPRFAPSRLAACVALTLVFAVAAGSLGAITDAAAKATSALAAVASAVSPLATTVTICHQTGSATNPYVTITVSSNGLNGHGGHAGDLIPAPPPGCPSPGSPPPPPPPNPGNDQYKPGKGCGDKNHVHFREGQCKNPPR